MAPYLDFFILLKLSADEITANCILCTEETNEIQVVSEEEPQRESLRLPQEPSQEQVVADRPVGGRGFGGAGELSQPAQVPENQENEDPERDQLVIRDGQEEQDTARKGE